MSATRRLVESIISDVTRTEEEKLAMTTDVLKGEEAALEIYEKAKGYYENLAKSLHLHSQLEKAESEKTLFAEGTVEPIIERYKKDIDNIQIELDAQIGEIDEFWNQYKEKAKAPELDIPIEKGKHMKKTRLTTAELIQFNELLENDIEGLDAKFQTYLQESMQRQVDKDMPIAKLVEHWQDMKQKFIDVKQDMHDMIDSYQKMNRETKRKVSRAYNTAVINCHSFYQTTLDSTKQGLSILASLPGRAMNAAKEKYEEAKVKVMETVESITSKVKAFGETVKSKIADSYAVAKFAVIDFSADRLASLAGAMDKLYDNAELKMDNCYTLFDRTSEATKPMLDTYHSVNKQLTDVRQLRPASLRTGCFTLNERTNDVLSILKLQKLSPAYQAGKRSQKVLDTLEDKIAKLEVREQKIDSFSEKLRSKVEAMKEKVVDFRETR